MNFTGVKPRHANLLTKQINKILEFARESHISFHRTLLKYSKRHQQHKHSGELQATDCVGNDSSSRVHYCCKMRGYKQDLQELKFGVSEEKLKKTYTTALYLQNSKFY